MAATFYDVVSAIALTVGGTQPDAVNKPYWFSGYDANDGTGVANLHGCYAEPPSAINDPPIGIILPTSFTAHAPGGDSDRLVFGMEEQIDDIRLWILVRKIDPKTAWPNLAPFRDTVPDALRQHLQFGNYPTSIPGVEQAWINSGQIIRTDYAGVEYAGWEFNVRVMRLLATTNYAQ